jgi:hypothetical protein
VAGGVAHRAEPAHRQPGDGPAPWSRGRTEVRLDPGDELVDVEGLPFRRPVRAEVVPVGVPPARARIRHDHQDRKTSGDCFGVAFIGPGLVIVVSAVQQIEHGIGPLRISRVTGRLQDPDMHVLAERIGRHGDVQQSIIQLLHRHDMNAPSIGERGGGGPSPNPGGHREHDHGKRQPYNGAPHSPALGTPCSIPERDDDCSLHEGF